MMMRDAFFYEIARLAETDEKIVLVTADMSAPALDEFRRKYPHRYINVGIAEQSMILTACGLAKEGFKPVCYAIQPFAALRCYEQIKVVAALMNIPIMIAGVGAGFSYEDSGPTHHALEDLAIMRILPNMTVWNCSSNNLAVHAARQIGKGLSYVRLDRQKLPEIYPLELSRIETLGSRVNYKWNNIWDTGFHVVKKAEFHKWIVSTGNMVHRALEVTRDMHVGVIDVFKFPFNQDEFRNIVKGEDLTIIEENNSQGGLAAAVYEVLNENHHGISSYDYVYGGRENIQKFYGLDEEGIKSWLSD